jgi:hypothetical protein
MAKGVLSPILRASRSPAYEVERVEIIPIASLGDVHGDLCMLRIDILRGYANILLMLTGYACLLFRGLRLMFVSH